MKGKWHNKNNQVIIVLAFMFFAVVTMCLNLVRVNANEQTVTLSLDKENPKENVPFQMTNMFPGDSKTQYYSISASYSGTIIVNLQATTKTDEDMLGEVLEIQVSLPNTGEVLYEGKLADMPVLSQELSIDTKSQTDQLDYKITVGLSTSVGNEYQNTILEANIVWWVEVEEQTTSDTDHEGDDAGSTDVNKDTADTTTPITGADTKTGDDTNMMKWSVLAVCAAVTCIVFIIQRKREEGKIDEQ